MWAKRLGLPLTMSPLLPFNTLPIMRGVFVAEERDELDTYLKTMFEASFVQVRNLHKADEISAVLDAAGLDAEAYFAGIQRGEIKDRLRHNSDDAVARGVFGVPSFLRRRATVFRARPTRLRAGGASLISFDCGVITIRSITHL